ncbi:MAG: four helix bundle protein [Flavobacteriaceae bacterium]|nr:four helix bundle protein [Flavobacteriaceae bacterium]
MESYVELDVWKNARALVKQIYQLVDGFPDSERFSLIPQIGSCSLSIPSNIAEDCGRYGAKDTLRFLFIARGFLYELETQLYLSYDLSYLSEKELKEILKSIEKNKKLLNGFRNYFKNQKLNSIEVRKHV